MKRVCVFCGSSTGSNPLFQEAARGMGAAIARRGLGLVYGGGGIGLMAVVADAALAEGGEVTGVIPAALGAKEVAHARLSDLRVVGSMHERKALMADLSDAFLALPGAYGTLDEFCEMLTWAQLGLHRKPCGLLNVGGFYDHLLAHFDRLVTDGLLSPLNRSLVIEAKTPDDLLDALVQYQAPIQKQWIEKEEA
ncbi:MAG: TIGR00730 family Rossman fold protein [Nitrospirae bacterium]|nr:MAG: TIGR00730 family Rossman fold protein [Nitrospirota bacterium]